jgi:2-Cys peroxiredoxin 5
MSSTTALRRFATSLPRNATRPFHSTARAFVKAGDAIPSVELMEKSPGNKVNLAQEIKGKALIIGVPAAFSMWLSLF